MFCLQRADRGFAGIQPESTECPACLLSCSCASKRRSFFSSQSQKPRSLLLLAAIADHTDVGHLEMAMFGRILIHAMLFHFIFDYLFGAVEVGSSHFAGHGYGMTPVRRESDCLAVKLPGGTIFGC